MLEGCIKYNGYKGSINYEEGGFWGKIELDNNDLVLYDGDTLEDLIEDFKNGLESYLDFCKEIGK